MTDETAAIQADQNVQPTADSAPAKVEPLDTEFTSEVEAVQSKFNKLTEKRRSAERLAEDNQRRADESARDAQYWRDQALRAQQPAAPAKPAETAVKTLADFEYDESKYQGYLFEQAETRAVKAAEKRLREQQETDTRERRKSEFTKRETEFEKANPDYRSKTRSPSFPVSDAMAEVFAESEEGPAVAYYLANNASLAETIARLSPLAAARELGRIEAKLISAREAAAKTVSNAPPPPPKIEGSGDQGTTGVKATDPDSDKLSDEEWTRRRTKQLAKQQRGS